MRREQLVAIGIFSSGVLANAKSILKYFFYLLKVKNIDNLKIKHLRQYILFKELI